MPKPPSSVDQPKRGPGRPPKNPQLNIFNRLNLKADNDNDEPKSQESKSSKKAESKKEIKPIKKEKEERRSSIGTEKHTEKPPEKRKRGRPFKNKPPEQKPNATEEKTAPEKKEEEGSESEEEDDIPNAFSDVVKIIIQKVQETQNDIRNIEESYLNYKSANEETTILILKFYAAVPKLLDRVRAGEKFNDELLNSVFTELFPINGAPKTDQKDLDRASRDISRDRESTPKRRKTKK